MAESHVPSGRPETGEFASYATSDIAAVSGNDAVSALLRLAGETSALFTSVSEVAERGATYAPGKWTLKEILGHLVDDERIFCYRLLCVARGEPGALPGFDQEVYVASAGFEERTLESLLHEYAAIRAATVATLEFLSPEALTRRGTVNGYSASPRGLAFHVAGHELHHHRIIEERYLPLRRKPLE